MKCVANRNDKKEMRLSLHVQPGARQTSIVGFKEGVLYVKIAAPPEKGKANERLIDFLSEVLHVSKSSITILRGTTGRMKVVAISGCTEKEVMDRLVTLVTE